jgi:hypothetical protein
LSKRYLYISVPSTEFIQLADVADTGKLQSVSRLYSFMFYRPYIQIKEMTIYVGFIVSVEAERVRGSCQDQF